MARASNDVRTLNVMFSPGLMLITDSLVGLIAPMSHAFCAECSRIRITADGKLKPCLHSDAEITLRGLSGEELEQAIRRGILMKPERHHMDETGVTETHRGMFAIGG